MDPTTELPPPPEGFKYEYDLGKIVLDDKTGKPKLIPIDAPAAAFSTVVGKSPEQINGIGAPAVGVVAPVVSPPATQTADFVPEAAKDIKDNAKQTFKGITDFTCTVTENPKDAAKGALKGMSTFAQDFFDFIARGNVLDLAVAIIVGNAFTAIVTSLTNDMISPILGLIGNKDLSAYNTVMRAGLSGNTTYPTPAQAKADSAVTLAWGSFLNSIVNFLIISLVIFLIVRAIGLFYRTKETITSTCFWCKEEVQDGARRCGKCGSQLPTKEQETVISELEKQVEETLGAMATSPDLEKIAIENELLHKTNAVMTGKKVGGDSGMTLPVTLSVSNPVSYTVE